MTQKHFERHWTKADAAEAAGNYPLAAAWIALTRKQLELDPQYQHKGTMQALDAQEQRITNAAKPQLRMVQRA